MSLLDWSAIAFTCLIFQALPRYTERWIAQQLSSPKSGGSLVLVLKDTSETSLCFGKVCDTCSSHPGDSWSFGGVTDYLSYNLAKLELLNCILKFVFPGSATFTVFCFFPFQVIEMPLMSPWIN